MTVLNVAFPLAPVGPDAVGGAEQVCSQLDEALVACGYRSLVVACEGSRTAGTLIAVPRPLGRLDEAAKAQAHRHHREAISRALREHDVDLVHLHGVDFLHYLPPAGVPVLVTLHLPPPWYDPAVFALDRPDTYLQCVSQSQYAACPPGGLLLPPILNGVDTNRLTPGNIKRNYALALGRICAEKGFHHAIDACKRQCMPFLLGGEVFGYEEHRRYFEEQIEWRLDDCRRFLGPVHFARKRALLAAARCLLVPSLAPETSSLVAMEALACGTPVIAFRSGALPEVVEHGRTGLIVDDEDEMVAALARVNEIDPAVCRQVAVERFSLERMTAEYLTRYRQLSQRGLMSAPPPRIQVEEITTTEALEALAPAWDALWQRCPYATPFQTPAWNLAWWRQLGHGALRVLAVWDKNDLIGLAPLFLYHAPAPPHRRLLLLGTGVTDRLDLLLAPGQEREAWAAVRSHLAERGDEWDCCQWEEIGPDSPLHGLDLGPLRAQVAPGSVCPVLVLPGTVEQFHAGLSSGLRRNLRRYREQWQAHGALSFETACAATLPEFLAAFFDLHAARWRLRGEEGVLHGEGMERFHQDAATGLMAQGLLRLHGIRFEGRLVAAVNSFRAHGRAHSYLGGFDPAFSRYSPGTLILGACLESAIRDGCRSWDFLRGSEPYKYVWGAHDEELRHWTLRLPHAK